MLKIWRWLGKGKDFVQWAELKFKLNWFNFGGRKGVGFLKNLDILTAPENLRKESKNNNNLKKRVTHPHTNTHTYIWKNEENKFSIAFIRGKPTQARLSRSGEYSSGFVLFAFPPLSDLRIRQHSFSFYAISLCSLWRWRVRALWLPLCLPHPLWLFPPLPAIVRSSSPHVQNRFFLPYVLRQHSAFVFYLFSVLLEKKYV